MTRGGTDGTVPRESQYVGECKIFDYFGAVLTGTTSAREEHCVRRTSGTFLAPGSRRWRLIILGLLPGGSSNWTPTPSGRRYLPRIGSSWARQRCAYPPQVWQGCGSSSKMILRYRAQFKRGDPCTAWLHSGTRLTREKLHEGRLLAIIRGASASAGDDTHLVHL